MEKEDLFENTKVSSEDQKKILKNLLHVLEEHDKKRNNEFGIYILELLKEYPEIVPEKQELNFLFQDMEREFNIDLNKLEKKLE